MTLLPHNLCQDLSEALRQRELCANIGILVYMHVKENMFTFSTVESDKIGNRLAV
jgi:hypothetical protein